MKLGSHTPLFVFAFALGLSNVTLTARAETTPSAGGFNAPAATAPVQGTPPNTNDHGACKADVQKYCSAAVPGHGAIWQCLKQHQSELSAGCQADVTDMKQKVHQRVERIAEACEADREKYCPDVPSGHGRVINCLRGHHDQLTSDCQQAVESIRQGTPTGGAPSDSPVAK